MARTAPPRVLLVEDEPAQRAVLAYNLEAEGFDVIQSDNGCITSSQLGHGSQRCPITQRLPFAEFYGRNS